MTTDPLCPHWEFIVRITCHEDVNSEECLAHAGWVSEFSCDKAECKNPIQAFVKAETGCDPITLDIPAEMQAALKDVPF